MNQILRKITAKTVPVFALIIVLVVYATPSVKFFVSGIGFVIIGELIRIWACGHLRKNKEVTTTGPYAYVKNPLYLGTFLIMVGFSIIAGNPYIMALGAVIFVVYYAPFKKKAESDRLEDIFGDVWRKYNKSVPDYIPKLIPYPERGMHKWEFGVFRENSELGTFIAVLLFTIIFILKIPG